MEVSAGLRRVARHPAWEVGALVLVAIALVRCTQLLPGAVRGFDFNHYYAGARMLWEGDNPYTTGIAAISIRYGFDYSALVSHASNTPAFLYAFVPLTWLSPPLAFAVWTGMQLASLAVILGLTRLVLATRWSPRGWRLFVWLVLAATPVLLHLTAAQMQLTLAALLLGAFVAHQRGHGLAACWLVAVAGLLKLFPLVLLPWFVLRGAASWAERLRRVAWTMALVAVVVGLTGPRRWVEFSRNGLAVVERCGLTKSLSQEAANQTLASWVIDLGSAAHGFAPSADAARWIQRAGVAAGLAVLAVALLVAMSGRREDELEFVMLSAAMLVGIPVAWSHYFVVLIFPVAVLVVRIRQHATLGRVAGVAVLALALVDPAVNWQGLTGMRHHVGGILASGVMLYAAGALAVWLALEKHA